MRSTHFLLAGLLAVASLSGCKIVVDEEDDGTAIAEGAAGDDARTALRIDETFEGRLLPYIRDNAVPVAQLRTDIAAGLDAAGEASGHRGAGAGAAWNFPVSGEGVVVAAKLDTRARSAALDTDGDGTADVTLQLGPVIRGTALRDVAPFYNFDDFRDQIEFAKLGRAINDESSARIKVPEGDLTDLTIGFVGVVPLKSADEELVVTPTRVEVDK
ncbi:DUF2291 family protein [Chachezhania antarctica]|uniref:DUF2291 family protein n=1 Tax=Chachezhania antarctica TaxID=2340860 RepID=UPI000EACADFC|nr:DUF2291 domain-containing protein [Chachezhania antarctica]|tara:strand:+ start:26222 stop:26866 length:645 start_codon:yes stop_codon:yes gene_type:complete